MCFCHWTPSCLRKKMTVKAYTYYKWLTFWNGVIILLYSRRLCGINTLKKLFQNTCSIFLLEKKSLKTEQLFLLLRFFLYIFDSVPGYSYLHHGPYSQPADHLQNQFKFHHFSPYLDAQRQTVMPSQPTVSVHICRYPYIQFPQHTHEILKYSLSSSHVPFCLPNNPAKPIWKHSFKLLTLLERSLFLCKLPSVWESAYMPSVTKTLGQF